MNKKISIRELYENDSVLGYGFNEILIEDQGFVRIHSCEENTDKVVGPFEYVDEYHFRLNGRTFHVDEYGEILYRNHCKAYSIEQPVKKKRNLADLFAVESEDK